MTTASSGAGGGPGLDPVDVGVLRGSRTVAIVVGVISLAAGIAILVWPDHAIKAVAVIAGIGFLLVGIAAVFDAIVTRRSGSYWGLLLLRGVLDIIVGLVSIFWPEITVTVVAILIGIDVIVGGIIQLALARQVPKGVEAHSRYVWRGILWIVAGIAIVLLPTQTATVVAIVIGIFFVASGLMMLFIGVQLGKAERTLA